VDSSLTTTDLVLLIDICLIVGIYSHRRRDSCPNSARATVCVVHDVVQEHEGVLSVCERQCPAFKAPLKVTATWAMGIAIQLKSTGQVDS